LVFADEGKPASHLLFDGDRCREELRGRRALDFCAETEMPMLMVGNGVGVEDEHDPDSSGGRVIAAASSSAWR
jgi:hypothetical protein